jgi:predicted aldo/keto reductase-like oxidoreductase
VTQTKNSRREFLQKAAGGAVAARMALPLLGADAGTTPTGEMPYRTLGGTGEKVSLLGMGGWPLGGRMSSQEEATRFVRTAIDSGINYLETSWDYLYGLSENRLGKALLDGYRKRVFLATKIDGRSKEIANNQLQESLHRLHTDCIDLVQFHEVLYMDEPDKIFGSGGAIETVLAARNAGKLRFIGFTGHYDPDVHVKLLNLAAQNNFRFDTGMIVLNVMDAHYKSFTKKVLPLLMQHGTAILAFKSMAGGRFLTPDNVLARINVTTAQCLHYVMNLPVSVVISGMDNLEMLKQNVETARNFQPLPQTEVSALLAKTADAANAGQYEWFKGPEGLGWTKEHPEMFS